MSYIPYSEDEARKSNLLLQAVLLRSQGQEEQSASCFAEAATLEELLSKKSIRVHDLRKLNLDVKPGHGPVLWASLDGKKEVWFWCSPRVSCALGVGKIRLVATVIENDENNGTIIWPKDKIGMDYGKELDTLYKRK